MFKFPTVYSSREPVYSETGSPTKEAYAPVIKDDGSFELEVVGKINVYDEIQSHADSCDINIILERYARGDVTALSRRQGLFADLSEMPRTYAEMLNVVIKAQAEFEALPANVKEKFDNDVNKFISRMDDVEFMRSVFPDPESVPVEKPVVSDVKE